MERAGSVIHSTFAINVMWSGGYEGARNECKKSDSNLSPSFNLFLFV